MISKSGLYFGIFGVLIVVVLFFNGGFRRDIEKIKNDRRVREY